MVGIKKHCGTAYSEIINKFNLDLKKEDERFLDGILRRVYAQGALEPLVISEKIEREGGV